MRIFDPKRRYFEILSGRLGRLEEENGIVAVAAEEGEEEQTNPEDSMTPEERHEFRFNWFVHEIMPYYKAEVMRLHNITSDEEYTRRILDGDMSIYLPQPNTKFQPTPYNERVAHALGLDYQQLQDKFEKGEPTYDSHRL